MSIGKSSISRAEKAASHAKSSENAAVFAVPSLAKEANKKETEAAAVPAGSSDKAEVPGLAYLPTADIFSAYAVDNTVCSSLWRTLIASVEKYGVIEPIVVRQTEGGFRVISGHKRLFAAKKLGLSQIPARIMKVDDRLARELAAEVSSFTTSLPYEPAERAAADASARELPDYLL